MHKNNIGTRQRPTQQMANRIILAYNLATVCIAPIYGYYAKFRSRQQPVLSPKVHFTTFSYCAALVRRNIHQIKSKSNYIFLIEFQQPSYAALVLCKIHPASHRVFVCVCACALDWNGVESKRSVCVVSSIFYQLHTTICICSPRCLCLVCL